MNRIVNTIVIFTQFIKSQNAVEFQNEKNGKMEIIYNKCILDTQRNTIQQATKTERNVCVPFIRI